MSVTWSYFWPAVAAGLAVGAIGGTIAFRRRKQLMTLLAAAVVAVGAAALWHGPIGAANRFTIAVDRSARLTLDYYEMYKVSAQLRRAPLSRTLALTGPADDFQRSELVRVMSALPGVTRATWSRDRRGLPLLLEAVLASLTGFLVGALLAYLVELRRRYNAQWKW